MDQTKEKSTTMSAPYTFARCFNAQCTLAEKCLRRMAALYDTNNYPYITCINPTCIPTDTNNCEYFRTIEKSRVAWGVKRLFDKVPYKEAVSLRNQIIRHFGRSAYYRYYREERYLSPEDQNYIRRVFRQNGISEDLAFERYTEEYNW